MLSSPKSLHCNDLTDTVPEEYKDLGTNRVVAELVWYTVDRFARKHALHDTRLRTQRIRREALADPDARHNNVQMAGLHAEQP